MLDRGQLTVLLGRIWVLHAQQLDILFRQHKIELTADQYRLMHLLWTRNGAHQEYYARKLGRDRSALTRMLDTLEEKGYLERVDDRQDQRAKMVFLKTLGKQLEEQVEQCANEVLLQMWDGIASEEREQLNDFLNRLLHNIQD